MGPGDLRKILGSDGGSNPAAGDRFARDPNLLVGIETGDDAAVYRLGEDDAIVTTTDFITPVCDDPFLYGQVAAANALSDVFAMGGVPLVALALCGFPEALEAEVAAEICAGGAAKVREAGAVIGGGHTIRNPELFYGLAVTGRVHPARVVRNVGAQVGDALVLTKPLGTGVVINGARAGKLDEAALLAACRVMATLNRAASLAMVEEGAHAATDVTGFGLAGHALGMARGSNVGFRIALGALPLFGEVPALLAGGVTTRGTRQNREAYGAAVSFASPEDPRAPLLFDPQTAGGLLIAVDGDRAVAFLAALHGCGVESAAVIGEVVSPGAGGPRIEVV